MTYHGSPADITEIDRDICLATDPEIATSYVTDRGLSGYLYAVELDGTATIADEGDIREAAQTVADRNGGDAALLLDSVAWTYQLLDLHAVRTELASRGFDGASVWEANIDNGTEHTTIRIWAAGIARITARATVA